MVKNIWPFKDFHLLQFKRNITNAIRYCWMGNTKDSKKLNFDKNTKDNLSWHMYTLLAIVLVFYQNADIQNIQEIWLPFPPSNLDLFPSHAMFIWPCINVRQQNHVVMKMKYVIWLFWFTYTAQMSLEGNDILDLLIFCRYSKYSYSHLESLVWYPYQFDADT